MFHNQEQRDLKVGNFQEMVQFILLLALAFLSFLFLLTFPHLTLNCESLSQASLGLIRFTGNQFINIHQEN